MADQGYDVWMGNARGNKYSRAHNSLDPDGGLDFWNFSWNEIGSYDLPVMIDYALAESGQENLFYVGHSQVSQNYHFGNKWHLDHSLNLGLNRSNK